MSPHFVSTPSGQTNQQGAIDEVSDQALRAAFFSLPAPAAILDEGFRFVAVSHAFSKQFEYAASEVVGHPAKFLYDPSLHEVALNTQRLISSTCNAEFQLQRVIRTRSGRVLDSTVAISGLPGSNPPQYVALYQNVTDAYVKERVLLSRAEMFRLMVENSPLPISVQDHDWRLVLVNQAYCDFTGYQKSELLGRDPATLLHPADQLTDLPAQRQAIQNLNIDEFPHHQVIREIVRRDGSTGRYSSFLGFTRGPAGESLWCATLIDLSALDKLRGQLNEQSDLAGRMRARFDQFCALSDDGIAIVDRGQNRIVHANQALPEMLGIDQTLLVGEPLSLLWQNIHEDDQRQVDEVLALARAVSHTELTIRVRQVGDGNRWIRMRLVLGEENQPEYFLVFEDVSELIERQEVRERQAAAQMQTIVREVHHRIKNHLQGVLGLLPQRDDVDPQTNAMIAKAATQIAAIAEVHGILTRSLQTVTLTRMVTTIAKAATRVWDIPIEIDQIDDAARSTYSVTEKDSVPLALLLNELILNAIKHRSNRNPISIVLRPAGHRVRIQISNVGKLPPDFDFDTLPAASGLGLVRSLFAKTSSWLTLSQVDGRVVAELELAAPVVVRVEASGPGLEGARRTNPPGIQ